MDTGNELQNRPVVPPELTVEMLQKEAKQTQATAQLLIQQSREQRTVFQLLLHCQRYQQTHLLKLLRENEQYTSLCTKIQGHFESTHKFR